MSSKSDNRKTVEGDFSAPEIEQIQDRRIEGSFSTDPDELNNRIEGGIENSEMVGVFDTSKESLWSEIKNSRIHGDIDATDLLNYGENSIATGGHVTTERVLGGAEQSLILGDTVQVVKGEMGNRGLKTNREEGGNVVAGRDVTLGPKKADKLHWSLQEFHPKNLVSGNNLAQKIASPLIQAPASAAQSLSYALDLDVKWPDGSQALGVETPEAEGMPVISEGSHPDENVTEYHGDWDELSDYLMDRVPEGYFRGFGVFNLPGQIDSVEELDEVVREVGQKYPEVEDDIKTVEDAIRNYDLPALEGTNQEIFERITEFQELTERGDEISIEAYDDPEVDGLVYKISSSEDEFAQFNMHESPEALAEAIEQSPLESEEAGVTLGFLDVPQLESAEELLYELKAREIIGSEVGEAYKFANQFSDDLKLKLPWEENEGLKSKIKSLVGAGSEKDQREIYSRLKEIDEKFDFEEVRQGKEFLESVPEPSIFGDDDNSVAYRLSGSTDERYQQLLNIEDELMEQVEETWDLGEEAMEVVEEGKTNYLMRTAGNASDYEGGGFEEFLLDFRGGKPDRVLEPGFSSTKFTDGEDALDSREEATDAAYSEGVELLNRISNKQGNFSVEHPEIEELEEELDQTIDQISNSQGRPPEELIQKKNRLKSEIPEKRREVAFNDLGLEYGEDTDYSDIDPGELRQVLDQLGQEYLEGDEINPETDAGKASDIAGRIDMSDEVGNGYVDFEVYDKDIMNLPSDDRRVPCTFPGGSRDGAFIDYMKDPGTQIALLESGEDNGAVISHPVKQEGQDHLLVHSVESNDGITSRNDVSMAIREQIEEYASEADMEGVIYSTSAHNTAAEDFIEAAVQQDPDYHEQTYTVDKKGSQDVHLDFNLPEVQGYKVEL